MKDLFKNYLFEHHILVGNAEACADAGECFCTLVALAEKFGIRIREGAMLATPDMVGEAAECLGEWVPEPFYRGFPETVRQLTSEQRLFDQLYHYTQTYGNGWFSEVGHSVNEEIFRRLVFTEETKPKDFVILEEKNAEEKLIELLGSLLESSRPLNSRQNELIWEALQLWGFVIIPEKIPCRQTAIQLLCKSRDLRFADYLRLSDVIKLAEYIQYYGYGSEKMNALRFRNADRKLIERVLNRILDDTVPGFDGRYNVVECMEKRKTWCGLLHHIHYKPKNAFGRSFCNDIRDPGVKNYSAWSVFESYMRDGYPVLAAKALVHYKGTGALMRNLNYILSRCENEHDIGEVLACLK